MYNKLKSNITSVMKEKMQNKENKSKVEELTSILNTLKSVDAKAKEAAREAVAQEMKPLVAKVVEEAKKHGLSEEQTAVELAKINRPEEVVTDAMVIGAIKSEIKQLTATKESLQKKLDAELTTGVAEHIKKAETELSVCVLSIDYISEYLPKEASKEDVINYLKEQKDVTDKKSAINALKKMKETTEVNMKDAIQWADEYLKSL